MRLENALRTGVLMAVLCLCAAAQTAPGNDAPVKGVEGVPPRAAPTDYQVHGQVGAVTIGAEFAGHEVPTLEGSLTSEEYVAVEVGLYGPPEARLKLSAEEFWLRINGRKTPLASVPYGLVVKSVRDPLWEPPEEVAAREKSKTSLNGGGGDKPDPTAPKPGPPPVPVAVRRAWTQRVQKAVLPEGDRALPQAGLLFFQYSGRAKGIQSVELIYKGPAGTATLKLQP
jgi:hypothetical protein